MNPRIAELKRHIECEYSIRDGGAKLLQASKNTLQSVQASKGLFVSDAKIIGYMKELQQHHNGGTEVVGNRYFICTGVAIIAKISCTSQQHIIAEL